MKKSLPLLLFLSISSFAEESAVLGIPQLAEATPDTQVVDPYLASGKSGPIPLRVQEGQAGIALQRDGLFGTDLAIWNPPSRYEDLKPYLVDAGFNWFRFPNGSLSNEYHWNGTGKYDSTGVWSPDSKTWSPGFLGETLWRGTTKDNYGFKRASHLVDGDSTTMWWGAIFDPIDPPWFVVDLKEAKSVDSVQIQFGALKAKSFQLMAWDHPEAPYPYPHQLHDNHWLSISGTHFPAKSARYWGVKFMPSQISSEGVQVAEFRLYSQGAEQTMNHPDASIQSMAWGISTRQGDFARTDWTGIKWHFEEFMNYIKDIPQSRAVICVNVATGTPEEAAAWVKYANIDKKYQIRDWQIGNENDGQWEEAGPLSARQYAAKFIRYALAMKAVDPSIRIHGPLHSTDEFLIKGDGLHTGKSWMERFLITIGEAEKLHGKKLLDAVDFHTYPYWKAHGVDAAPMVRASSRPGPMMDTLTRWMNTHLENGAERQVHLSEFSSTVIGSAQTLSAVQATSVTHLFAQFIQRFANRGHALAWDTYGGLQKGPDESQGSLRMADPMSAGQWSSWVNYHPSAQYYGLYLAFEHWTRQGYRVTPVSVPDSAIRAFALSQGDSLSVLLFNMAEQSVPVRIHREKKTQLPLQIFRFSGDNFKWNGTDASAHAVPGMGPWSNRSKANDSADITIAPLGIALVKWGAKPQGKNKVEPLHMALEKEILEAGDTLRFWSTIRQREGSILKANLSAGSLFQGEILPADKQFGGELEGFSVTIPIAKEAKPGRQEIILQVEGIDGKMMKTSIPFRIRGKFRTTQLFTDFDKAEVVNYPYAHGSNSTSIEANLQVGNPPLGAHLRMDFKVEQPKEQSWPNFAGIHFIVPDSFVKEEGVAGIVFDYATTHSNENGYFELLAPSTVVKDYDEYVIHLRNTHGNWVRDTVLWSDMKQEGWGKAEGPLQSEEVRELEFRARVEGRGSIRVDNIFFLAEEGKEIPMPQAMRRLR